MLDLDHFKAFNDRHGHEAGNELLKPRRSRVAGGHPRGRHGGPPPSAKSSPRCTQRRRPGRQGPGRARALTRLSSRRMLCAAARSPTSRASAGVAELPQRFVERHAADRKRRTALSTNRSASAASARRGPTPRRSRPNTLLGHSVGLTRRRRSTLSGRRSGAVAPQARRELAVDLRLMPSGSSSSGRRELARPQLGQPGVGPREDLAAHELDPDTAQGPHLTECRRPRGRLQPSLGCGRQSEAGAGRSLECSESAAAPEPITGSSAR